MSGYKSKLCFCLCSRYSDTECMGYPHTHTHQAIIKLSGHQLDVLQLSYNINHPELAQIPQVKGSIP